jgi:hypothetical protein
MASTVPETTTYEYGTRDGIDGVLREIEQSGRTATSLLVTRGHVELEIFVQPAGTSADYAPPLSGAPVGTYTSPPQIRDAPANPSGAAGDPAGAAGVGGAAETGAEEASIRGEGAPTLSSSSGAAAAPVIPTVTLNAQLDMDLQCECGGGVGARV